MPQATSNSELLKSFVKYCQEHPDQKFWQALADWCEWGFVLVARYNPKLMEPGEHAWDPVTIEDTYHWEGRFKSNL